MNGLDIPTVQVLARIPVKHKSDKLTGSGSHPESEEVLCTLRYVSAEFLAAMLKNKEHFKDERISAVPDGKLSPTEAISITYDQIISIVPQTQETEQSEQVL
jgi:hypothetical protein